MQRPLFGPLTSTVNPSVSLTADSSPYTGEPMERHEASPLSSVPLCGTPHIFTIHYFLPELRFGEAFFVHPFMVKSF